MAGSKAVKLIQISTDTLFDSQQCINIIKLPKTEIDTPKLSLVWGDPNLLPLTAMVDSSSWDVAINGGFFDVDRGGGVAYFEVSDSVINRRRWSKKKWRKPKKLVNGCVLVSYDGEIRIEQARSERYYRKSDKEVTVMQTGPLLLLEGQKMRLPNMGFCRDRHPRSVLGYNEEYIFLICIDGRQEGADGMSLEDVQTLLEYLGCQSAINLDGGGSSTLWMKGKGIVNSPSDPVGPRPIANGIVLRYK